MLVVVCTDLYLPLPRQPPYSTLQVFAQADVNRDGDLELDEYVPAMVAVLAQTKARNEMATSKGALVTKAAGGKVAPYWQKIPEAEPTLYLKELFAIGDANQDGSLEQHEFASLLSLSGLGFDPLMSSQVQNCVSECSAVRQSAD